MIVAAAFFALSLLATPNCVFAKSDSSALSCQWAYRTPIDETTSEILSDGSIRTIQGDVFDSDDYVEVNGTKEGCVCHLKTCIRKCCPKGEMLINRVCNDKVNALQGLVVPEKVGPALNNFHVTYGMDCGTFHKKPQVIAGHFNVSEKGVLTLPSTDNYEFFDYCLEYTEQGPVTIVCMVDFNKLTNDYWSYLIGMIISSSFLLLTFIVYALLPEKNIYNRLLMCYVMSMMLGNVISITMGLIPLTPAYNSCTFLGMICYFFNLVISCCVNVIAYNFWSTFRNIRAPTMSKSRKGKKRTLFYILYVVGIPLVMVFVVITLTKISKLTAWYNPRMGIGNCWFSNLTAVFIYIYLPVMINVLISTILFASTAWHMKKIKNDTKQLKGKDSQKHEKDKQLFIVYFKLCLFMGINSAIMISLAVVNLLTGGKITMVMMFLGNVMDIFTGIFIFFLFVFKKSIWKQLKQRFNNESDVTIIRNTCGSHEDNSSNSNVSNNTIDTNI